jgi:predicted kinase
VSYSWDDLRHRWYDPVDYSNAFKLSTEDPEFNSKAQREFVNLIKSRKSVVVDNTNLSAKRRRFFVSTARQAGYRVVGVVFPVSLETVLNRQETRPDKSVPEEAVRRQYMSVSLPSYGEVDDVFINQI